MSLLRALSSPTLRGEAGARLAGEAGRDAVAARVIQQAAVGGNVAAKDFVKEAKGRLAEAAVRGSRAEALRSKAATATAKGAHQLAVLAADVAATEDAVGAAIQGSVIGAVRSSYGASEYLSPREAQLLHQSEVLSDSTSAQTEAAFSNLLSMTLAEGANFGVDDPEGDEHGAEDGSGAWTRIGLAAEILGGHLPVVLGAASIDAIGGIFSETREKLEKRLAARRERLKKIQSDVDDGKKVFRANARIKALKRSISKTKAKLAKLSEAEGKVTAAASEQGDVAAAEADARNELLDIDSEDDEDEDNDLMGAVLGSADEVEAVGFHPPRPPHHPVPRHHPGGFSRRGAWRGRGGGPAWVAAPVVDEVVAPVYDEVVVVDEGPAVAIDDEDEDLISDIVGSEMQEDEFGGGSQPVASMSDDAFLAFFDGRAQALGAPTSYGAGSQPIASIVELYGDDDDHMGNALDGFLDFFSNLFQGKSSSGKTVTHRKHHMGPVSASSSVTVKDGPYTYRKDPDGTITIVGGPTGVGKRLAPGSGSMYAAIDAAVQREVAAGRVLTASSAAAATMKRPVAGITDAQRVAIARSRALAMSATAHQRATVGAEEPEEEAPEAPQAETSSNGGGENSSLPSDDDDLVDLISADDLEEAA